MAPRKKPRSKKELIAEAELTERVASLCPKLVFDDTIVQLVTFGLHPSFAPDSALSHHQHNYIEMHITLEGDGVVVRGQDSYKFTTGQFVINQPDEVHYWHTGKKSPEMVIMGIKIQSLQTQTPSDIAKLMINIQDADEVVYATPKIVKTHYDQLTDELKSGSLGYSSVIRDLLRLILVSLARATVAKNKLKSSLEMPPSPFDRDSIVDGVNEYMRNHLSEKISLDGLGRMFHVSRRTLTRHYKQQSGQSVAHRLRELRMARAEELVRETKLLIKAVSTMCGFTNKSFFSKEFRKCYGYSPIEYRNQIVQTYELD